MYYCKVLIANSKYLLDIRALKDYKKGNTHEPILTKTDKGKRNDCLQFLRIQGGVKKDISKEKICLSVFQILGQI